MPQAARAGCASPFPAGHAHEAESYTATSPSGLTIWGDSWQACPKHQVPAVQTECSGLLGFLQQRLLHTGHLTCSAEAAPADQPDPLLDEVPEH